MTQQSPNLLKVTMVAFSAMLFCTTVLASNGHAPGRGKVVIIRGAFTVFSLGLNDLGEKLREYGYDVDVVADISASRVTSKLISDYQRNSNFGPIVFIGHSRGAELGPKQARKLKKYGIPVKLVVMVDGTHKTSIPANVERCVNLYHNNAIGVLHGVPTHAEGRNTQLLNVDINKLESRHRGGTINHFNIDSSDWIHDLVISEVLRVIPTAGSSTQNRPADRPTSSQSHVQPASYSRIIQPTRAASFSNQQPPQNGTGTCPPCSCGSTWVRFSN